VRVIAQVVRRLLHAAFVVFGVTLVTFVIARVLPGNPVYLLVGTRGDEETVRELTRRLGLDKPLVEQYWIYMKGLVQGDLGMAFTTSRAVTSDLGDRLPATLELAVVALLLALVIAVPLGVAAALRPRGVVERITDAVSAGGAAVPQFWLGLMLIYFFFFRLGWAPPPLGRFPEAEAPSEVTGFLLLDTLVKGDFGAWKAAASALVLPAVTLALTVQPPLLRLVQVAMRRALESDAVRTARAAGLSFVQVVYHDALRLALLPVLNMIGLVFGILLSSSVLVETVFAWPGIGQYSVQAISASDYAAVQGVVLVAAIIYVSIYLVLDLVEIAIDPRVRA
jgi:ABC-type dipeptide/oligopeptide/nickel transport system permease component